MEEKRNSSNWVWVVVAVIVGLLLTCGVSAVAGGIAGYFAGQWAAQSVPAPVAPEELPLEPSPRIPRAVTPSPAPRLPEGFPFGEEALGGALVMEVIEGSPAEEAGLRVGDIITEVDDRPLRGEGSLSERITDYAPGDEIELTVLRGSRTGTLTVELGRHPDMGGDTPWLGIRYRSLPEFEFEFDRPSGD